MTLECFATAGCLVAMPLWVVVAAPILILCVGIWVGTWR